MSLVAIERIAAGGDGVGRLADGRTVFVPRTAPGDSADVDVIELKPRFARGRAVRIETASTLRVASRCPHYTDDECGGCQLQHIAPAGQVDIKRRIVGDALRRIAGRSLDDPPGIESPDLWRYRGKITLAVRGDIIGLHRFNDADGVFPLTDCLITDEALMQLWAGLRPHRALLPRSLSLLILRQDRDGGVHVVVQADAEPWNPGPVAEAVGLDVSWWWHPEGGAPRIVAGKKTGFPVMAFAQTNAVLADRIRADAVTALGAVAGSTVWDLYGGVGDTARLLSAAGARVWSVDADRGAIEWARRDGSSVTYLAGRAEDVLSQLPTPDAVIVNPPRTGMHDRVTVRLAAWRRSSGPRRLVYVSCDPATLARDVKRLPSFNLLSATAYDLFPQTAHVETLAVLEAS